MLRESTSQCKYLTPCTGEGLLKCAARPVATHTLNAVLHCGKATTRPCVPQTFLKTCAFLCLMILRPEALVPIMKGARQLVLVGDHKQLPPVVQSEEAKAGGLQLSLFQRLLDMGAPKAMLQVRVGAPKGLVTVGICSWLPDLVIGIYELFKQTEACWYKASGTCNTVLPSSPECGKNAWMVQWSITGIRVVSVRTAFPFQLSRACWNQHRCFEALNLYQKRLPLQMDAFSGVWSCLHIVTGHCGYQLHLRCCPCSIVEVKINRCM